MKKLLKRVLRTKSVTQEELGQLLKYISLPENSDKFYLNTEVKEDRIGKYRILIQNPEDKENLSSIKIYEKKDDKDLIIYKIQYYDILREEVSNTKKSMQLFALQKSLEYAYKNELKINDETGEFKELVELLEKVKKARAYYALKVFLNDNSSSRHQKSVKHLKKKNK